MRKSIMAAAIVTAAIGGSAQAAPTVLASGEITAGNPVSAVVGGISEIVAVCGGDESFNGIDGIAFDVPAAVRNTGARLVTTGQYAIDADVYWYDAECALIEDYEMAELGTANENGIVPGNAIYGVVDLTIGAEAKITLTAGH